MRVFAFFCVMVLLVIPFVIAAAAWWKDGERP